VARYRKKTWKEKTQAVIVFYNVPKPACIFYYIRRAEKPGIGERDGDFSRRVHRSAKSRSASIGRRLVMSDL
jgi:hypothetical protein